MSKFFKPRTADKKHESVKPNDVSAFFMQLSTLFKAGTPLMQAIEIAADQSESRRFAAITRSIGKKIAAGSTLNGAMLEYPKHFKREWVEVVRSGEISGQLGKVLSVLVSQIKAADEMKAQLKSAMMYPVIIMVVAVLSLTVMLVKVVPTFAQMFDSMDKELPGITQVVLNLSYFLRDRFMVLIGAISVVVFSVRYFLKTPTGRKTFDQLMVSFPLVGEVVVQTYMQKYASNMALLLRAGLPLHEAINALKGVFETNIVYKGAMITTERTVGSGGTLAGSLEASGAFTAFASKMTRIGESSGTLPEVLDQVEEFYKGRIMTVVGRVTKMLETVAILGMGVAVAVILCAIYLPLFSMASGV